MARKGRRGAGEGTVYQRKSGPRAGQWVAQLRIGIREDGRPRIKTGYGQTQKEALEQLDKFRTDRREGRVADPGRETVKGLVLLYLDAKARSVRETTHAHYVHTMMLHVVPRLGGVRLASLQPAHVEAWLADLHGEGTGPRALQAAFDVFKRVLTYGVSIGLLARNPAIRVDRPRVERPEVRALDADQTKHLLAVARQSEPAWVVALVVLGLCGLRRGEALGVAWRDVTLDGSPSVRVRQQVTETGVAGMPSKGVPQLGPPKSRAAVRTVPLPSFAETALRALRADIGAIPHGERLLFATRKGTPHSPKTVYGQYVKPLFVRAGFPWLTYHGLRHTFCTLSLGSGVDLRTLQEMIGHKNASMTLDIYAGFIPSNADAAAERLGRLLG